MDRIENMNGDFAADGEVCTLAPRKRTAPLRIANATSALRISVRRAPISNPQMSSQIFDSGGFFQDNFFGGGFFTKPDAE